MAKKIYTSEAALAEAVLKILDKKKSGEASFREIIDSIPSVVVLTQDDLAQSPSRTSEVLWEQRVRNITSHYDSPSNFIYKGYLISVEDGLKITDDGRKHAQSL